MSENVIVSFSSKGREDYNKSILRLIDSCVEHWMGDILIYSPDHELNEYRGVTINKGWPKPKGIQSFTHEEMPYQFKTAMIQLALEMGYKRIIWLDSSMQLAKDPLPLLLNSKTGIVTFHNLGHPVWKYISDNSYDTICNEFMLATDVRDLSQVWGGAFMLDTIKRSARDFFRRLKVCSVNGSFKDGSSNYPGFVAHRHDQAVMSVLLQCKFPGDPLSECDMLPYGKIVSRAHAKSGEYGNDYYIIYG